MEYERNRLGHEYKYYINSPGYYILKPRLKEIMSADRNMKNPEGYRISSLYFDDMYETAMEEKTAGIRFRKKFRIRVYERDDTLIRLECKMKFESYIAKVSAFLTRKEYDSILGGNYDFLLQREEEVCRELYFLHRTKLLRPVVVVEYLREAYISSYGNVRITFDKNIGASLDTLDMLGMECPVTEILPQGILVLEVKYDDYLPVCIAQLLQLEESNKCAISKYVLCRNKCLNIKNYQGMGKDKERLW